ncbi:MAG: acetyl-CoA carboxylase biotin carboxyl carrier protein subunit [Fimbriimonas sp.]
MAQLDIDLIRHALTTARKHGFAEVELAVGEDSFAAKLAPAPPEAPAPIAPPDVLHQVEPQDELIEIRSTLVGYYRAAKTPLQVGTIVNEGDVVAVIGALGIANDIESPVSGEVVEVLVEQNQPVEYGQVLARILP